MGRSRGGLATKIHAVVDGYGLPIELKLTVAQPPDLVPDGLGRLLAEPVGT